MPTTLRDVADHAGVSMRTVSNVVSGYEHVSAAMRKRVMAAIEALDYRPNPVARTLRTGRTGVLALVVPEIDVPYFSELARNVIDTAAEVGYRVVVDQTGHDHERERRLLLGDDRAMLFDGLLFSPLVTKSELLDMHGSSSVPLVLLGEHDFDGRFDHVAVDNERAARDATAHLVALGRRRIAAIGAQPLEEYATPLARESGYLATLDESGMPFDPALVRPAAHWSRQQGYDAATDLLALDDRPDAVFCFSDLLAIGAMRAVADAGLRVPDDVAVIGIDDVDEGRFSRPSLSTVSLDTPFIARESVRRIIDRIAAPELPAVEITAPHRLVVRESAPAA